MAIAEEEETPDRLETRTVSRLTLGTKLFVLAALAVVAVAIGFLVAPNDVPTKEGQSFHCGSAVSPESGEFAEAMCSSATNQARVKGGAILLIGLILAGGGYWAFGTRREQQVVRISELD